MFNFLKAPLEEDNLLDDQQLQDQDTSLNKERQKLSYWVRFACALAGLIAVLGVTSFSFLFVDQLFSDGYWPYKSWMFLGGTVWVLLLLVSVVYMRSGHRYATLAFVILSLLGIGVVLIATYQYEGRRIFFMPIEEALLLGGGYLTGFLAIFAAFSGWNYAQALRIPQFEEDWTWKAETAKKGLNAWRLGALAFIVLGMAWTPILVKELRYYYEHWNDRSLYRYPEFNEVEAVPEDVMMEDALPDSEPPEDAAR